MNDGKGTWWLLMCNLSAVDVIGPDSVLTFFAFLGWWIASAKGLQIKYGSARRETRHCRARTFVCDVGLGFLPGRGPGREDASKGVHDLRGGRKREIYRFARYPRPRLRWRVKNRKTARAKSACPSVGKGAVCSRWTFGRHGDGMETWSWVRSTRL